MHGKIYTILPPPIKKKQCQYNGAKPSIFLSRNFSLEVGTYGNYGREKSAYKHTKTPLIYILCKYTPQFIF